uniref:Uncharacterized protein n=1 Tax=Arundo donax TaxID=35708 RepID=A0A0A9E725_ARUDO
MWEAWCKCRTWSQLYLYNPRLDLPLSLLLQRKRLKHPCL